MIAPKCNMLFLGCKRRFSVVFVGSVFLCLLLPVSASDNSQSATIRELFEEMRKAIVQAPPAQDSEHHLDAKRSNHGQEESGGALLDVPSENTEKIHEHVHESLGQADSTESPTLASELKAEGSGGADDFGYPDALEKAVYFQQEGNYEQSIRAYVDALNQSALIESKRRRALFGLAEVYYEKGAVAQSISILDQYLERFPGDARRGRMLFQKGLMYHESGFYDKAIATYYRVLNSIVVSGDADVGDYLRLARRAQFEIARSHYDAGQWEQSLSLLERIEMFELSPVDRETVLFYKAKIQMRVGRRDQALLDLNRFLQQFPESELIPEVLYNKAEVEMRLQRHENAFETLMALLEEGGAPEENMSDNWVQWRKLAGNFFSNHYFQQGDYLMALRLYQGIVVLDPALEWQLPIVFQMAVCFEKLALYDRAEESLRFVIQQVDALRDAADVVADVEPSLQYVYERAQWRIEMVEWRAQQRSIGTAAADIALPAVLQSAN